MMKRLDYSTYPVEQIAGAASCHADSTRLKLNGLSRVSLRHLNQPFLLRGRGRKLIESRSDDVVILRALAAANAFEELDGHGSISGRGLDVVGALPLFGGLAGWGPPVV